MHTRGSVFSMYICIGLYFKHAAMVLVFLYGASTAIYIYPHLFPTGYKNSPVECKAFLTLMTIIGNLIYTAFNLFYNIRAFGIVFDKQLIQFLKDHNGYLKLYQSLIHISIHTSVIKALVILPIIIYTASPRVHKENLNPATQYLCIIDYDGLFLIANGIGLICTFVALTLTIWIYISVIHKIKRTIKETNANTKREMSKSSRSFVRKVRRISISSIVAVTSTLIAFCAIGLLPYTLIGNSLIVITVHIDSIFNILSTTLSYSHVSLWIFSCQHILKEAYH